MEPNASAPSRREFLQGLGLATAGVLAASSLPLAAQATRNKIKLGLDNFAVRAMGWKAPQLVDYAASLKTDSLFITDLNAFESLEDSYLKKIRSQAEEKGLQVQLGTWSICPTSKSFKKDWGTAEEHLRTGIRAARALGSPVLRVVLGSADDRKTPGGIEARIEDTVKVCKALKNEAVDSGVKIAVENHAGDMMSWELVQLIEAAGKDFVGANIDPGNAAWTLEDPVENLKTLAPYVLTSSMRDSAIWESANGITVQWTAMGEGNVDLKSYFQHFGEHCPNAPVHIETISGFAREFPIYKDEFWGPYQKARAKDLAKFMALAKKGKAIPPGKANDREYQKGELERSIKYCKETLGLGLKS